MVSDREVILGFGNGTGLREMNGESQMADKTTRRYPNLLGLWGGRMLRNVGGLYLCIS
jgi:hypothetical protein